MDVPMNVTIYTAERLENLYFTPDCHCSLSHRKLVLTRAGDKEHLVIRGDAYILQLICENLTCGVRKNVLLALLSRLPDATIYNRMMEGKYIE